MSPLVTAFFDEPTFTYSYIVQDPNSKNCAIIDSVLNFDYPSGRTRTESADKILQFVNNNSLNVEWVLETHVHADHLSAAPYLKEKTGAKLGIGANITVIQDTFGTAFNADTTFVRDGSQFDVLFNEGDTIQIGTLTGVAMHTPGHTPACITYVFEDAVFVGDTLFMPDFGTARCDFPGGDPRTLYQSIKRIFALAPETRLFMCHDYKALGRDVFANETSVQEERAENIHVRDGISEDEFVKMRTERDATLSMPQLILPSVQVNMRAGKMPPAEENDQVYLKVPINLF
ncbi:MBL fold metallo-hydrolase [Neptunomonas sp.]|uniref:MBL fold metallo-hydrolase n=1 Tax=Neptunomonas sp. TaxID=1971898 RepID=UPI0025DAA404|nr:MBL fold metallo-hydrolase [Neptunomonas sp.]